jgi:hypothetical protein
MIYAQRTRDPQAQIRRRTAESPPAPAALRDQCSAVDNWRAGAKSLVEPNWVAAFSAAEAMNGGSYVPSKSVEIVNSLLPSFQAHIRFDLPRAIASVYERHYAGIPGISPSLFKPDYDAMSVVFQLASNAFGPEIYDACWYIDPGAYEPLRTVGFPWMFDIALERELTWDKAARIIDAHLKGILAQPDVQKELKAAIFGADPDSLDSSFEVGDITVKDYDWSAQP